MCASGEGAAAGVCLQGALHLLQYVRDVGLNSYTPAAPLSTTTGPQLPWRNLARLAVTLLSWTVPTGAIFLALH